MDAQSRLVAIEGGYHGHEGMRRWWNDLLGVLPDYSIEPLDVRDLGDVTLCLMRSRAHGRASTTPVVDHAWQAARWRNGKCVWWRVYSTEAEAFEALGVRE